jgi:hypothetical protein
MRIAAGFAWTALATVAIVGPFSSASAGTVVVDRSTFDADTTGQSTVNFNNVDPTLCSTCYETVAGANTITLGSVTFTASSPNTDLNLNGPGVYNSTDVLLTNTYPPGGTNDVLTITLASPVTAFGLDFASGQNPSSFSLSNGFDSSSIASSTDYSSPGFVGFISSDPFNTITLSVVSPEGWAIQDAVTAVATTPLPAALPMFAGGLGLVGFLARRKKREAANA